MRKVHWFGPPREDEIEGGLMAVYSFLMGGAG